MSAEDRKKILDEISKAQLNQEIDLFKMGLRRDVINALKQLEGLKTQFLGILELLK